LISANFINLFFAYFFLSYSAAATLNPKYIAQLLDVDPENVSWTCLQTTSTAAAVKLVTQHEVAGCC
jgi:hypothetical protein